MRAAAGGLLLAVLVLGQGCQRRDDARLGGRDTPIVLVLSPAHGSAADAAALGELLSRHAELVVEVRLARSPDEAVKLAGSPGVDGGLLSLFEYLLARQEYGVTAVLQAQRGDGARTYAGVLWIRADAPIRSPADLAGRTVAFVDRASTTGYLLAARLFVEGGIEVHPLFTGSHEAAVAALLEGRADAAATYERPVPAGAARLAGTGEVPNEPIFFRADLPADKRERVTRAFVTLAGTEAGRALLARMAGITGFAPVGDGHYDAVGELLSATRRRLEDLVPGGWQLVNENRLPLSELGPY